MASSVFEDASPDFRPNGRARIAGFFRWLARLLAIGTVTLVVAYYLPLHRAHRALAGEYGRISSERDSLVVALADARAEVRVTAAARDALQATTDARAAEARKDESALSDGLVSARKKLEPRKLAAVSLRDRNLVAAFPEASLKGIEMSPPPSVAVRLGLCDVATALSTARAGSSLDVVARPTSDDAGEPRQSAALRAAHVAETLESVCRVAPGSVGVVVRGAPAAGGPSLELVTRDAAR